MYSSTTDPSIVCALLVCVGRQCTVVYTEVQSNCMVVCSSTVYLFMNIYIHIYKVQFLCVFVGNNRAVCLSGVQRGDLDLF